MAHGATSIMGARIIGLIVQAETCGAASVSLFASLRITHMSVTRILTSNYTAVNLHWSSLYESVARERHL